MLITKKKVTFEVEPEVVYNPGFWDMVNSGVWEEDTYDVMEKVLSKDHTYLDIGAWVGPTVLFGAQHSKHCYAFEPDRIAYNALIKNLNLNPKINNVTPLNLAVSNTKGTTSFGCRNGYGDSMSSLLWSKDAIIVNTTSLKNIITEYKIDDLNFIKMDIEGGEFIVLPDAKEILRYLKINLHLALHAPFVNNQKEYIDVIKDTLSIYKSFYNREGKKISFDEIYPDTNKFTAVYATMNDL